MGLTQRNIPCLDLKDGMTIRYMNLLDLRDIGKSIEHALICNKHEVATFNGSQPTNMDPVAWAKDARSVTVQVKFL
jgi:imidazole glycerol phosphate synthase subunit HisF